MSVAISERSGTVGAPEDFQFRARRSRLRCAEAAESGTQMSTARMSKTATIANDSTIVGLRSRIGLNPTDIQSLTRARSILRDRAPRCKKFEGTRCAVFTTDRLAVTTVRLRAHVGPGHRSEQRPHRRLRGICRRTSWDQTIPSLRRRHIPSCR